MPVDCLILRITNLTLHDRHHRTAVVSCGWANVAACRLQVSLLRCPLPDLVPLAFVQLSLRRLICFPFRLFLSRCLHVSSDTPSGDTRRPLVVFDAVESALPGTLQISRVADYVYDFSPLSDQDVGPSILVGEVEPTSLYVGLCGS